MDESLALGVLGARGRGAAEAAGLQPKDVDIISASLSTQLMTFIRQQEKRWKPVFCARYT